MTYPAQITALARRCPSLVARADGVAYWSPGDGIWTGTFVDATHDEAWVECINLARTLAPEGLPDDGEVIEVRLQIVN